jgi:hypothetical protein
LNKSTKSLAEAICAILLLEECSLSQALSRFLTSRKQAIEQAMDGINQCDKVSEGFTRVVRIYATTLHQMLGVFLPPLIGFHSFSQSFSAANRKTNMSLIEKCIASLTQTSNTIHKDRVPSLSKSMSGKEFDVNIANSLYNFHSNLHLIAKYLPENVHKAWSINVTVDKLNIENVRAITKPWVKDLTSLVQAKVNHILGTIITDNKDLLDVKLNILEAIGNLLLVDAFLPTSPPSEKRHPSSNLSRVAQIPWETVSHGLKSV